jgi:hypothetical protein
LLSWTARIAKAQCALIGAQRHSVGVDADGQDR